jgi:hypothetical protein
MDEAGSEAINQGCKTGTGGNKNKGLIALHTAQGSMSQLVRRKGCASQSLKVKTDIRAPGKLMQIRRHPRIKKWGINGSRAKGTDSNTVAGSLETKAGCEPDDSVLCHGIR